MAITIIPSGILLDILIVAKYYSQFLMEYCVFSVVNAAMAFLETNPKTGLTNIKMKNKNAATFYLKILRLAPNTMSYESASRALFWTIIIKFAAQSKPVGFFLFLFYH